MKFLIDKLHIEQWIFHIIKPKGFSSGVNDLICKDALMNTAMNSMQNQNIDIKMRLRGL